MQKNISTQHLKNNVGEIMDSVRLRGDRYIVERRGKPVAEIVPLGEAAANTSPRQRLFEMIEAVHERNRGIPSEEIQSAIQQAIAEVRAAKRERQK